MRHAISEQTGLVAQRYRIVAMSNETLARVKDVERDDEEAELRIMAIEHYQRQPMAAYRRLVGVQHPNCVRLRDVGRLECGTPFLISDARPTETLQAQAASIPRARRGEWAMEMALLLLEPLMHLHAQGIVHGSLELTSIRGRMDTGTFVPVLSEFGHKPWPQRMVLDPERHPYLAPEILCGQEPTPRTDCFALGVLVETLLSVALTAPESEEPKDSTRLADIAISDSLRAWLSSMRAEEPSLRPADASEALAMLRSHRVSGDRGRRKAGTATPIRRLLERDTQRHTFRGLLDQALHGQGSSLVIMGPSGAGRTRFIQDCSSQCWSQGIGVVRLVGSELLGPGENIVAAVMRAVDAWPQSHKESLESLRRSTTVGTDIAGAAFDSWLWQSRVHAFIRLFAGLRQSDAWVIMVDDLDRSGRYSREIALALGRAAAVHGLIFVIAGVSESGLDTQPWTPLQLGPLSRASYAQLVRNQLDNVLDEAQADAIAAWLHAATAGVPRDAIEWLDALSSLIDHGETPAPKGSWMPTGSPSETALRLATTRHRMESFSVEARQFAAHACLFGARFDPRFLVKAEVFTEAQADLCVLELHHKGVLVAESGGWPLRFVDPGLRANLIAESDRIISGGSRAMRERLASALQSDAGSKMTQAAWGRQQAALGDPSGVASLLLATDALRAQHGAPELLEMLFEAEGELETVDGDVDVDKAIGSLRLALAELEWSVGHFERARLAFEGALEVLPSEATTIRRMLGQLAIARGEDGEAMDWLEQALRAPDASDDQKAMAAYHLGHLIAIHGLFDDAERVLQQGVDSGARASSRHQARLKELEAVIAGGIGDFQRAANAAQEAADLFGELRDPAAAARNMLQVADILRLRGDFDEAIHTYSKAIPTLDACGAAYRKRWCHRGLASVAQARGELTSVVQHLQEARDCWWMFSDGDELAELHEELAVAYVDVGRHVDALTQLQWAACRVRPDETPHAATRLAVQQAFVALEQGDIGRAQAHLERTATWVDEREPMPVVVGVARARLELGLALGAAFDQPLWRRAVDVSEVLGANAEQTLLWRLKAKYHRVAGQFTEAKMALEQAGLYVGVARLERLRNALEGVRLVVAMGNLDIARPKLDGLELAFRQMGAANDLAAVRGLSQTVTSMATKTRDVGNESRAHLDALTAYLKRLAPHQGLQEYLDDAVRGIFDVVSPAERSFLIVYDERGNPIAKSAQLRNEAAMPPDAREIGFSRTITESCLADGKTLYVRDAMSDSRFSAAESVVALRLCTVVAVPLMVGQRCRGVLYVDTSQVVQRALEDAVPLLETIAALVAVGLERIDALDVQHSKRAALGTYAEELKAPVATAIDRIQIAWRSVHIDRTHLQQALNELEQLRRMIDNLNDYTRTEAGDEPMETVVGLQLAEVAEVVSEQISPLADEAGVSLAWGISPELPFALGAREAIIQLLSNLLTFLLRRDDPGAAMDVSARAAPVGPIEVPLLGPPAPPSRLLATVQHFLSATECLTVELSFGGGALDPGARHSLLGQRHEPGHTAPSAGHVGLVAARMVVERHGGAIEIRDEDDEEGGIIRFTLPAMRDD